LLRADPDWRQPAIALPPVKVKASSRRWKITRFRGAARRRRRLDEELLPPRLGEGTSFTGIISARADKIPAGGQSSNPPRARWWPSARTGAHACPERNLMKA